MSKRLTFVLVSLLLTAGLGAISLLSRDQQVLGVGALAALTLAASVFALRTDILGIAYLIAPSLPALFVLGIGFTLFFFPNLSSLFKAFLLSFSFIFLYIILLVQNIFNVALSRAIPLYRAAKTASFLLTLLAAFLLFTAIYKANLPLALQVAFVVILSSILGFQALWAQDINPNLDKKILFGALLLGFGVGEAALSLSFLPLKSFFRAIALTTAIYIGLGIGQQYLKHKLSSRDILEYGITALIVGLILATL